MMGSTTFAQHTSPMPNTPGEPALDFPPEGFQVWWTGIRPLPGFKANGRLAMFISTSSVFVVGKLFNLEPSISAEADCLGSDGCGLRMHTGTTCETYDWTQEDDFAGEMAGWASIRYTSTSPIGKTTVSFEVMCRLEDLTNKVVILHNSFGTPMACGEVFAIEAPEVGVAEIEPVYGGTASGQITAWWTPNTIFYAGIVGGLQPNILSFQEGGHDCNDAGGCGVQMRDGDSCADVREQNHLVYPNEEDPWPKNRYGSTDSEGVTRFVGMVRSSAGTLAEDGLFGKPWVVKDKNSIAVGCGLLAPRP